MNKLITRNPIQRFKQGRKIIKAKDGYIVTTPTTETIGNYVREKNRSLFGSGWRWYDIRNPRGKDHIALDKEVEVNGWILKPDGSKISATLRNRNNSQKKSQAKQPTQVQSSNNQENNQQGSFGVKSPNSSTNTPNNQTNNQQRSSSNKTSNSSNKTSVERNSTSATYTGTVWDYLNSKAKNFGDWTTNNKGNKFFTITNDDGSKVNVFGNGQMYDMAGNLIGTISEQEVRNASQRGRTQVRQSQVRQSQTRPQIEQPQVQQPQVEQPTQAQQPVNINYTVGQYIPNGQFIPSGFTTNDAREAVKSTIAELNPQYMDEPGRYSIGTTLNRGDIRRKRNLYRNIDEYYDWLNSDEGRNSYDYKLFGNIGLWAPNLSEEMRRAAFDTMMNYYGISRNLGRRDSGRLANLLNNLSQLGSNSDMRGAFVDAYNNALDGGIAGRTGSDGTVYSNSRVRDLFDKVVVNPYTRYNSPVVGTLKYELPSFSFNQGLIPRNPVQQFKALKTGGILKFQNRG